jgi:hypothetical protein
MANSSFCIAQDHTFASTTAAFSSFPPPSITKHECSASATTPTPFCAELLESAERELVSFIQATAELPANDAVEDAGSLWLYVMETLEWDGNNPDDFCRLVSITTAAWLARTVEERPRIC